MSQQISARQVLSAYRLGIGCRSRPRTRWRNYIFDQAWSRLDVKPAELSEVAENREVFRVFLGLLPPRCLPEEKRVWKWINESPKRPILHHGWNPESMTSERIIQFENFNCVLFLWFDFATILGDSIRLESRWEMLLWRLDSNQLFYRLTRL